MEPAEGAEPPPQNQNPEVLTSAFTSVTTFLQVYGWFVVLGVAVLFYIRQKMSPTMNEWRRKKEQQADYAFDASVSARRAEAMEASRRRLQEQLDAEAEKFKEKQKQKDEEKRKSKIEDWDNHQQGKGYRSKVKSTDDKPGPSSSSGAKPRKTNTYRTNDYSPLTGGGGGGGYVPPRRGNLGGG